MANAVVQWTVDQLWSGLRKFQAGLTSLRADLLADKAQLTELWSRTKADPDVKRREANQKLLAPQIHNNSVLRMTYLGPLTERFNQAAEAGRKALAAAGYTTPSLSGLGVVVAIAPAAAVAVVVTALALLATAMTLTAAQRKHTGMLATLLADPSTTAKEKQALLEELEKVQENAPKGFNLNDLGPILVGVGVLMVLPTLVQSFRARRSA